MCFVEIIEQLPVLQLLLTLSFIFEIQTSFTIQTSAISSFKTLIMCQQLKAKLTFYW